MHTSVMILTNFPVMLACRRAIKSIRLSLITMQGTITMLTIYKEEENRTSYTWDNNYNEAR